MSIRLQLIPNLCTNYAGLECVRYELSQTLVKISRGIHISLHDLVNRPLCLWLRLVSTPLAQSHRNISSSTGLTTSLISTKPLFFSSKRKWLIVWLLRIRLVRRCAFDSNSMISFITFGRIFIVGIFRGVREFVVGCFRDFGKLSLKIKNKKIVSDNNTWWLITYKLHNGHAGWRIANTFL